MTFSQTVLNLHSSSTTNASDATATNSSEATTNPTTTGTTVPSPNSSPNPSLTTPFSTASISQSAPVQTPSNTPVNSQPNLQWKLLEMVQVTDDPVDMDAGAPMQWFKFSGVQPDSQGPIVLLSGFNGATKNDSRVLQLLQKALSSGVIAAASDIYLCPIVNPTSSSKAPYLNQSKVDILNAFPTEKALKGTYKTTPEVQSILHWIEKIEPKAVITLQSEKALLNHFGITDELMEKLSALAERPILSIGDEPSEEVEEEVTYNALGMPIQATPVTRFIQSPKPNRNFDGHIGKWCEEKEVLWLSLSVDSEKKSFDEIKEDWRLNIGPAMKWLLEAPRFNPPEQEPEVEAPTVVGVLDLPPEFMNL